MPKPARYLHVNFNHDLNIVYIAFFLLYLSWDQIPNQVESVL